MASKCGTSTAYYRGCRCELCRAAKSRYEKRRNYLISTGRWEPFVDADTVRAHIEHLAAHGVGMQLLAEHTQSSASLIHGILRTSKRVHRNVATRLLVVQPEDVKKRLIPADGARRRIQALAALGYSAAAIAAETGLSKAAITDAKGRRATIRLTTSQAVTHAYERLSMVVPPASQATACVIAAATRLCYLPPLAYEDELLDLSDADMAVELERRARLMDDTEARACYYAARQGDPSLLIGAGHTEHLRRAAARKRAQVALRAAA